MALPLLGALQAVGWLGSKLLGFADKQVDAATERVRLKAKVQQADNLNRANVITSAMSYKWFWIPWLLATVPLSSWFAWGVTDTMLNGALPDVAELPPQLERYANVVWQNIFYTGAGMGAVQVAARTAAGIFGRR